MSELPRAWRLHALLGAVPWGIWASFHLWEQWAAFFGRQAFVDRMEGASGPIAILAEIVLLASFALYAVLDVWLRRAAEPDVLRLALAEDPAVALRLNRLARAASRTLLLFVAYHAVWLWAPKLSQVDPLETWVRLRGLGSWEHAIAHAIGLTALTVHLWSALTRLAIGFGWVTTPPSRRGMRLSAAIVSICLLFLWGQLAGWHASGAGTFWRVGTAFAPEARPANTNSIAPAVELRELPVAAQVVA